MMGGVLNPGSSGPGSSPGRGHCVVLLGKTLTLTVPLSTQVCKWVLPNLMLGKILRWTSYVLEKFLKFNKIHSFNTRSCTRNLILPRVKRSYGERFLSLVQQDYGTVYLWN